MEGQSSTEKVQGEPGPMITNIGQPGYIAIPDRPEQIAQSISSTTLPLPDLQQQSDNTVPDKSQIDVSTSPSITRAQQGADDTDPNMASQDQQNLKSQKSTVDKADAVKRGRSFVLPKSKKDGEKPSMIGGILKPKATAKSPPPRSRQRLLSKDNISPDVTKKLEPESDADNGGGEGAPNSDEDEFQNDSVDEEVSASGQPRGRSGRATHPLEGDMEISVAAVALTDIDKPSSTSKSFHKQVRPTTNYNQTVSARREHEPHTSDSEEEENIRRAQKLPINADPINTTEAHRTSQIIHRGDFNQKQREAQEQSRRSRTYLVATDLSDEAAYALEWAIGTILRDGDTLIAIYACNEEVGTSKAGDNVPIGGGAKVMEEDTAEMDKTIADSSKRSLKILKVFPSSSRISSTNRSADAVAFSIAEEARTHAIGQLKETCEGFLRKTGLQVRILLEVIHSKDPNRMIMECIDCLDPLLVIVGSRGRTKLKGTLLGSFSNYVVSKSSAPVMVARKRLAGQKTNVTLANNLTTTRKIQAETPPGASSAAKTNTKTDKSPSRSQSPGVREIQIPLLPSSNKKQGAKIEKLLRSRSPRGRKS